MNLFLFLPVGVFAYLGKMVTISSGVKSSVYTIKHAEHDDTDTADKTNLKRYETSGSNCTA